MSSVRTARDGVAGSSRPRPGFSLVEVVTVAAIIAVLAGIAIPRVSSMLARQRIDAAARRIVVDLALAQRQAKTSSTNQTVRFFVAQGAYELAGMPHPDHPGMEYKVHLTDEPYGATVVSADFDGDGDIEFDIHGVPDSGGSVDIQVGNHVRTISVNPNTGKARVQ